VLGVSVSAVGSEMHGGPLVRRQEIWTLVGEKLILSGKIQSHLCSGAWQAQGLCINMCIQYLTQI
jgi:hypothetical protein